MPLVPARATDAARPKEPGYRLSLVMPAWNEEACIEQAIDEATRALNGLAADYEIIVVDDGSTDRTAAIVAHCVDTNCRVRLIRHAANQGYAAALRTGFTEARCELVAFTDADCQFELADLEYMLPLTDRYDIVCGLRLNRQDPPLRLIYSWTYNNLARLLLGSQVHDLDCALKIFRRDRLAAIWPEQDGYFVNAEMLTKARLGGQSIIEVGVRHRRRSGGYSKVSLSAIPQTLGKLLPFWWNQLLFPGRLEHATTPRWMTWVAAIVIALLAGWQLLPHLNYRLFEPDEGRYAEIGREMLIHQEWIVPTLHDRPYLDKPPLFYWALAASFRCFGTSDWAARMVPATAAWLTILATYFFGCRLLGMRAAAIAALAMTLAVGVVYVGRFLVLDGLLSLWIALALFTGFEGIRGPRLKWHWWSASAICCALGCLTKGPVTVALVAVPLVAHAWLNQRRDLLRLRYCLAYGGVVLAAVAPWFIAVCMRQPDFAYHFFIEHHLVRFVSGLNHPQPVWFYVPVLFLGGLPGTLLIWPWLRYQFSREPRMMATRAPVHGFFLLWGVWCLALFTAASCKLPSYILPAAPALALLLGVFCDQCFFQPTASLAASLVGKRLPVYASLAMALMLLVLLAVARMVGVDGNIEWIAESLVCCAIVCGLAAFGRRLSPRMAWGICCLMAYGFAYESSHEWAPAWAGSRSPLPTSTAALRLLTDPECEIIVVGHDWGSIPFYLGRQKIHTFDEPSALLKATINRHARSLFVAKRGINRETLATKIPADARLVRLVDAGRATFWLVEPRARTARANRTIISVRTD